MKASSQRVTLRYMPTKIWPVRQEIADRNVELRYVHTGSNIADLHTKALAPVVFQRHTDKHVMHVYRSGQSERTITTTSQQLWQAACDTTFNINTDNPPSWYHDL
eukprot:m.47300 g.47300  ORF g.47300 m.47300 type:complete len:105 (+) comp6872_c0_seq2:520-834(+)